MLLDVGPNPVPFNRAMLIAADHIVVPLAPDLHFLQALKTLGPILRRWREKWKERREHNLVLGLDVPEGAMDPVGYIIIQHAIRPDRPVKPMHAG